MLTYINERSLLIQNEDIESCEFKEDSIIKVIKVKTKDNKIYRLAETYTIEHNDCKKHYKINSMLKTKAGVKLIHFELNKTSQFILPLTKLSKASVLYNTYLLNAYLVDNTKDLGVTLSDDNYKLALLYRFDNSLSFSKLDEKLRNIATETLNEVFRDKNYIVYIFDIDKKFNTQIDLIMEGHYKMLDSLTKGIIRNFHISSSQDILFKALYNDDNYRKELSTFYNYPIPKNISLMSSPKQDFENEQLTFNNIR